MAEHSTEGRGGLWLRRWITGTHMQSGEEQAWEHLARLDPAEVCIRSQVSVGGSPDLYLMKSFGQEICISVTERNISSNSELGEFLIKNLASLSRLSILWYLIHSKELAPSGQWVNPSKLPGGDIYLKGTHVLPLAHIAQAFVHNAGRFLLKGRRLGGYQANHGDVSLQIFPFPRVPVMLTLWEGDQEFPPNCRLLLDSTCTFHLPVVIIWSTAMMAAQIMLSEAT